MTDPCECGCPVRVCVADPCHADHCPVHRHHAERWAELEEARRQARERFARLFPEQNDLTKEGAD